MIPMLDGSNSCTLSLITTGVVSGSHAEQVVSSEAETDINWIFYTDILAEKLCRKLFFLS